MLKLSKTAKELHFRILDKEENPCQYYSQEVKDELIKAYLEEPDLEREARILHNKAVETGNYQLLINASNEVKTEIVKMYQNALGIKPLKENK